MRENFLNSSHSCFFNLLYLLLSNRFGYLIRFLLELVSQVGGAFWFLREIVMLGLQHLWSSRFRFFFTATTPTTTGWYSPNNQPSFANVCFGLMITLLRVGLFRRGHVFPDSGEEIFQIAKNIKMFCMSGTGEIWNLLKKSSFLQLPPSHLFPGGAKYFHLF